MQSQKSNEEDQELRDEISRDRIKARVFADTIIGRKRLRYIRKMLYDLDVPVPIPSSNAQITHDFCKKYGKEEEPVWGRVRGGPNE